jgi:hypothetical protein
VKLARLAIAIIALSVLLAHSQAAEPESKWSLKKLVPSFGKQEEPLRGLYPEHEKPSLWQRFNRGTKTAWAKSKDALPSWVMPQTQDRARRSASSLKNSNERMRGEVRTARRSFFAPWRSKPEPEKRPETVSDFLGQPRPE